MDTILFADMASLILRLTIGWFFVLARFRWFWDPAKAPCWMNGTRHKSLRDKMHHCGWGNTVWVPAMVAAAEVAAGVALILGLVHWFAAVGLLVILVVGTRCTAREKTMRQNPVDKVDVVSCYLWTPEPVYIAIALALVALGPGRFSVDYWLLSQMPLDHYLVFGFTGALLPFLWSIGVALTYPDDGAA